MNFNELVRRGSNYGDERGLGIFVICCYYYSCIFCSVRYFIGFVNYVNVFLIFFYEVF